MLSFTFSALRINDRDRKNRLHFLRFTGSQLGLKLHHLHAQRRQIQKGFRPKNAPNV